MTSLSHFLFLFISFVISIIFSILVYITDCIDFSFKLEYFIQNKKKKTDKPKLVIIGGSFAGIYAARGLQKYLDVTLIEPKEYFEYTPGILRGIVEPSHLQTLHVDIQNDLKRFQAYKRVKFVHDIVTSVHPKFVNTEKNGIFPFDFLLIANGKGYSSPFMPQVDEKRSSNRKKLMESEHNRLKAANSIVIAGGGPVGVELCGEIVTTFPEKNVTLIVGNSNRVLKKLPELASKYAEKFLLDQKVKLIYNDSEESYDGKYITTQGGKKIKADILYQCTGSTQTNPKIDFTALKGVSICNGYLEVTETLQLLEYPNIYVLGDAMKLPSKEIKLAHTAELNACLAIKNITRTLQRKPPLPYPDGIFGTNSVPEIMVVSLGKFESILVFNNLVISGIIPAFLKWFVEWSKILQVRGNILGSVIWFLGDHSAMLFHKFFFSNHVKGSNRKNFSLN